EDPGVPAAARRVDLQGAGDAGGGRGGPVPGPGEVTLLLVALGGAVGALVRFLVDRAFGRLDPVLPWGTLTVNVVGSALLGGLAGAGAAVSFQVCYLAGFGYSGALTTWSTLGSETVRLATSGGRGYDVLNVGLTLVVGLAAAGLGWVVVS